MEKHSYLCLLKLKLQSPLPCITRLQSSYSHNRYRFLDSTLSLLDKIPKVHRTIAMSPKVFHRDYSRWFWCWEKIELSSTDTKSVFHGFKLGGMEVDVLIQTKMSAICTILPSDWYVPWLAFHLFILPSRCSRLSVSRDRACDAILENRTCVARPRLPFIPLSFNIAARRSWNRRVRHDSVRKISFPEWRRSKKPVSRCWRNSGPFFSTRRCLFQGHGSSSFWPWICSPLSRRSWKVSHMHVSFASGECSFECLAQLLRHQSYS